MTDLSLVLLLLVVVWCSSCRGDGEFRPGPILDGVLPSIKRSVTGEDIFSVVSFHFNAGSNPSAWVTRVQKMRQGLEAKGVVSDGAVCSIELLAVVPSEVLHFGTVQLHFIGVPSDTGVTCYFSPSKVAWERKHPEDRPPHPAFTWCPIVGKGENGQLEPSATQLCDLVKKEGLRGARIDLPEDLAKLSPKLKGGEFDTHAPMARLDGRVQGDIGVCTTAVHPNAYSRYYLEEFLDYHGKLGLSTIGVMDSMARHRAAFPVHLPPHFAYFNFTMWNFFGKVVASQGDHQHTTRFGDQDKSLSLTFCRFELQDLVKSVLIMDFDEYIFCPRAGLSAQEQGAALTLAVKKSILSGAETMVWRRSALYNVSGMALDDCLHMAHASGTSIFKCFVNWKMSTVQGAPRTHKGMHHGLPCPFTDNHVSCSSPQYPYIGCDCKSTWQTDCELAHLNPSKTANNNNWVRKGYEVAASDIVQSELLTIDDGNEAALSAMSEWKKRHSAFNEAATSSPAAVALQENGLPIIPELSPMIKEKAENASAIALPGVEIVYILTPPGTPQYDLRARIVAEAIQIDPSRKFFTGIYYSEWDTIKKLFKLLRIPTQHMPELRGTRNTRGKYALWISKLLVIAFGVQFKVPYLIMSEDDVTWSKTLRHRLSSALPIADALDKDAEKVDTSEDASKRTGGLLKLSKWGEGYFFSYYAARNFIKEVYKTSINRHSDTWIRDVMKPVHHGVPYVLAVKPNMGNVYTTHGVNNKVSFNYDPIREGALPLLDMLDRGEFFTSRQDRNLTDVAYRLTKDVLL